MKKKKFLFFIIICLLAILTALVITWKVITNYPWANMMTKEVQNHINGKLSIGNFYFNTYDATFQDIIITSTSGEEILTAKTVKINYSLSKYLKTKNPLTCISNITIINPVINATCSEKGEWNIQKIFKKTEEKTKEIPFNGVLEIQEGEIRLISRKPDVPVEMDIKNVEGKADLWANPQINFSIKAREKDSLIIINGKSDYTKPDIFATTEISDMDLSRWGKLIPVKKLNFTGGIVNARLSFSVLPWKNEKFLFDGKGFFDVKDGSVSYDQGKLFLNRINGKITLEKERINILGINGKRGDDLFNLQGKIFNFPAPQLDLSLDCPGWEIKKDLTDMLPLLKKYPPKGVFSLTALINGPMEKPFFMVKVTSPELEIIGEKLRNVYINGSYLEKNIHLEEMKLLWGKGEIKVSGFVKDIINSPNMDLDGDITHLNPQIVEIFLPDFKKYHLSGSIKCKAHILGSPKNPIIFASIYSSEAQVKGVYLEKLNSSFNYYNKFINITQLQASSTRGGTVNLSGQILILKDTAFYIYLNGEKVNIEDIKHLIPNEFFDNLSGQCDIKMEIAKEEENLFTSGMFLNSNVILKGQSIRNLCGTFETSENLIRLEDIYGLCNSSPVVGRGTIYRNSHTLDLYFTSPQMEIANFSYFYPGISKFMHGYSNLDVSIQGPTDNPLIIARIKSSSLNVKKYDLQEAEGIMYYQGKECWIPELKGTLTTFPQKKNQLKIEASGFFCNKNDEWTGKGLIDSSGGIWNGVSIGNLNVLGYLSKEKLFVNYLNIENIGGKGKLEATGYVSEKELNLLYWGSQLDLEVIKNFTQLPAPLYGCANVTGVIRGDISNPILRGRTVVENGKFGNINFSLNSAFSIERKKLSLGNLSVLKENGSYNLKGTIELEKPWKASLETEMAGGKISELKEFFPAVETLKMEGVINGNILLEGNLENVTSLDNVVKNFNITGTMSVYKAKIKGLDIDEVRTEFSLEGGKINLSNFRLRRKNSSLQAKGTYNIANDEISLNFLSPKFYFEDIEKAFENTSLRGEGQLRGSLEGTLNNINGWAEFQLLSPAVNNHKMDWATGKINFTNEKINIENLYMKKGDDTFAIAGYVNVKSDPELFLILNAQNVEIKNLVNIANINSLPPMSGKLSTQSYLRGTLTKPVLSITIKINNMNINSFPVEKITAEFYLTQEEIHIGTLEVNSGDMTITGHGYMNKKKDTDLILEGNNISLDLIEKAFKINKQVDLEGLMDLDLQAKGPTEKLKVIGSFQVRDALVNNYKISRIRSLISYDGSILNLEDLHLVEKDLNVIANGNIPVEWKDNKWVAPAPMDIAVTTSANDLNIINAFNPDFNGSHGELKSSLHIGGTIFDPQIKGQLIVKDGVIQHRLSDEPLKNLNISIIIDNKSITLENFKGNFGELTIDGKGTVDGKGAIYLENFRPGKMALNFTGDNLLLDLPEYFKTNVNFNIGLEGTVEKPVITGDISLNNYTAEIYSGLISSGVSPENSSSGNKIEEAFPVLKPEFLIKKNNTAEISSAGINPELSLNLKVGDNFWINNKIFNIKITGDLKIGGFLNSPTLSGLLDIPQGTLNVLGTKFDIRNGNLSFTEEKGIMPSVSLSARTLLEGREITVNINGPADNLKTDVSANPPLPENDIYENYDFTQQASLALAQTTVTSFVLSPVEDTFKKGLGLDVFSIKLSPTGTIGLEIGKSFNDWLSVSYHIYNSDDFDQLNRSTYELNREALDFKFRLSRYTTFNIGTNTTGDLDAGLQVNYQF